MKKIITENPEGMVQHSHNFVFVKDKDVYVRTGEGEMSLVEYIRKMDKELYGIEHNEAYCNALEFGEYMDDDRFTCEMYHALVGFAEVRNYLKDYEDKLGEPTVEALEKQIPKKLTKNNNCPNCNGDLVGFPYCNRCGQKIDYSSIF